MPRKTSAHLSAHGTHKAASLAPDRVQEALAEFKRLNTREARAAFADYWIGIWAEDFDYAWPMVYELLRIVDEDRLYADPRRVGPGAPGDSAMHGTAESYDSFAAYFEDRVKRPFQSFAEMESTYHYAQKYAPDLLKKAFSIARDTKDRATQGAKAIAQAIKDGLTLNEGRGPLTQEQASNRDVITIRDGHGGTGAEYLMRRIARDRPDILDRTAAGEFPSIRAAAIEAGVTPRTQNIRIDDPESIARTLRRYMKPDALTLLAALLSEPEDKGEG